MSIIKKIEDNKMNFFILISFTATHNLQFSTHNCRLIQKECIMQSKLKYVKILESICSYYGIEKENFIELIKNRDNKYILLLILKNNNCLDKEKVKEILRLKNSKSINNSLRLAEEKLLVNRIFRERYFEIEDNIDKMM